MTNYSSQSCFWFDYYSPVDCTEVVTHAQDHCTYAVTELTNADGEGWDYRLQLLQAGPQPSSYVRYNN